MLLADWSAEKIGRHVVVRPCQPTERSLGKVAAVAVEMGQLVTRCYGATGREALDALERKLSTPKPAEGGMTARSAAAIERNEESLESIRRRVLSQEAREMTRRVMTPDGKPYLRTR